MTPRGRAVFEELIPLHAANQESILEAAGLSEEDRRQLVSLLRTLLISMEQDAELAEGKSGLTAQLGLAVAPAHAARRLRRAVGLPNRDGLLLQTVVAGTAAARAGLAEGDLIVTANDRPVRTVADLRRASAARGASLMLGVVRGVEERSVCVSMAS
jgi:S1-C subfamily serine protease